ncbi:hypothetical protein C8J57DRAFT_1232669 [Mycena rebaudengoi]|nr:hypothetical protein C8J57DRAFT_1232669 [Mycena rebaudengoi]
MPSITMIGRSVFAVAKPGKTFAKRVKSAARTVKPMQAHVGKPGPLPGLSNAASMRGAAAFSPSPDPSCREPSRRHITRPQQCRVNARCRGIFTQPGSVLSGTIKKQQIPTPPPSKNFGAPPKIQLNPGVQTPSSTPKLQTNSNTSSQLRRGRRESVHKSPADAKLALWGVLGDQTDPLYLLQQLKKHVVFRKDGKTVTAIVPLEEAFNGITEIIFQALTEQSAEMIRLRTAEQAWKSQAHIDLQLLQEKLAAHIDTSTNYIANLIQSPTSPEIPMSQTQRPLASYAGVVKKPESLGNHDNVTDRAPISDAARKFQITVKTSRVDPNHEITNADPAKVVELFNKAIIDTVTAQDSNLLNPITARSARRLKSGDVTLQLRSQEEVDSIRRNAKEWLPRLAPGAWTHSPKHSVVVNGVPATFDPNSEAAIRTLEDDNPDVLLPYSIERARWLRIPKSSAGSIIIDIRDSRSANQAIDSGLSLNYTLFTVHKLTPKLTQCFKCQKYGHIAKFCKEATLRPLMPATDSRTQTCRISPRQP